MIPEAITRDLQNGMGLDECLKKHNTNLKILFNADDIKSRDPDFSYIEKRGQNYHIKKKIKSQTYFFGIYSSLEDAKKVRDKLILTGWKQKQVNRICEEVNVKRVPSKNEQRYYED